MKRLMIVLSMAALSASATLKDGLVAHRPFDGSFLVSNDGGSSGCTSPIKITFAAGGGSGSMPSVTINYDNCTDQLQYYTLPACSFTRPGYAFAGWQIKDNCRVWEGGAPVYGAGYAFELCGGDTAMELTATWTKTGGSEGSSSSGGGSSGGSSARETYAKARTISGLIEDNDGTPGTIQLKVGKISKKGAVKVSASITMLGGKKVSAKAVNLIPDGNGALSGTLSFKAPFGNMTLLYADGAFDLCGEYACGGGPSEVGGAIEVDQLSFFLDADMMPDFGDDWCLLEDLLPDGEPVYVIGGRKLSFRKAASPKYKRYREDGESWYELEGLDDNSRANLSGLKLTYNAKTGAFKGSFKLYATNYCNDDIRTPKLKKFTVSVSGIVIDGVGVGVATMKRPAVKWPVYLD